MIIGNKLWSLPIFLGIAAAVFYPYPAFQLNVVIYFLLVLIMFLTSLVYNFNQSLPKKNEIKYISIYVFFGMVFLPTFIWLLGRLLIKDTILQQGVLYMALSPLAIVAPHFVKLRGGNDQVSFQLMWLSNFIAPVLLFILTKVLLPNNLEINFLSYFRDMLFVGLLPILASIIIKFTFRLSNRSTQKLSKFIPLLNFSCIGLITYTLFGTIGVKIGFSALNYLDLFYIFLIALFMDFGTYFFAKFIFKDFQNLRDTLSITISIKNVALTAGLLLFYHPKMAFASALGLAAHAIYFFYLSLKKVEKSTI